MKNTPLHARHMALGAKMGAFAGYDMPLYYENGVIKEHEWVRTHAGLFDVSHMGACMVSGENALDFIHTLTPSDFSGLPVGKAKYTVLTNPEGGIIDDTIITRADNNAYHFVLNAGCKERDINWISTHLPDGLDFVSFDDWGLVALQGPDSEHVIRDVLGYDLTDMPYMGMRAENENSLFISRLGYTGEDGFELSVKNEEMTALWDKILEHNSVAPIGLAARDSLRLEMGYPLYGHDIDESTSPVEAGLKWIIGKENDGYFGASRIKEEMKTGVERVRVGIKLTDKGIAREGSVLLNKNGERIGKLTSGSFSPSLKEAIGMGYVTPAYAQKGTEIMVTVRNKNIPAIVTPMPFVSARTKSASPPSNGKDS